MLDRILNASCSCGHVTDIGIEGLCGGVNDLEMENVLDGSPGQCKKLQHLSIICTGVTQKGVQMALRQLPHLQVLEIEHVIANLADMHRNELVRPKYALTRLVSRQDHDNSPASLPYRIGDLRLAASLCPHITYLKLWHVIGVSDDDLLGLMVLERLRTLEISHWDWGRSPDECRITFDGGLLPLLKARGRSLQTLTLYDLLISVRVGSIVQYCPNLESLSFYSCSYSVVLEEDGLDSSSQGKRMPTDLVRMKHLKRFYLVSLSDYDIPAKALLLILSSSPSLEFLSIERSNALDDHVLREAFLSHPFESLENLEFDDCNSVSKVGIDLFMNESNNLKTMKLTKCSSVLEADIEYWKERAKENGWDFDVSM